MNKRGQIGIIITTSLLIVVGIILAFFLGFTTFTIIFFTSKVFLFLGAFLVVIGALMMYKSSSRGVRNSGGVLLGVGIVLILAQGYGFVQQTAFTGDQYIQSPLFGYYQCNPAKNAETTAYDAILPGQTKPYLCPKNTDQCTITIQNPQNLRFDTIATVKYNINGGQSYTFQFGNRVTNPAQNIPQILLLSTQTLNVMYSSSGIISGTEGSAGQVLVSGISTPYVLWKYDPLGGGLNKETTLPQGCTFTTSQASALIKSDSFGIGTGSTASIDHLDFHQTRNFLSGYVPISVQNDKIQNNGQAYCSNNQLYAIGSVNTTVDSYTVVNLNKVIGTVTCCNGDVNGNNICRNNKWVASGSSGATADNFGNCPQATNTPYNGTALVRQVNINGICTNSYTQVQCTSDSGCVNQRCDTKTYTCIALDSLPTPNPNTVQGNETQSQCQVMAETHPWLGYQWIESQTLSCDNFLNICPFGYGKEVTSSGQCKAINLPYIVIIAVTIMIFILALVYLLRRKRR